MNKEIPAQFLFPEDKRKLLGVRIENYDLSLLEITKIAFFALDYDYKLSIVKKDFIQMTIYSPEALKNNLNYPHHPDRRTRVLEEMKLADSFIISDPSINPFDAIS